MRDWLQISLLELFDVAVFVIDFLSELIYMCDIKCQK